MNPRARHQLWTEAALRSVLHPKDLQSSAPTPSVHLQSQLLHAHHLKHKPKSQRPTHHGIDPKNNVPSSISQAATPQRQLTLSFPQARSLPSANKPSAKPPASKSSAPKMSRPSHENSAPSTSAANTSARPIALSAPVVATSTNASAHIYAVRVSHVSVTRVCCDRKRRSAS